MNHPPLCPKTEEEFHENEKTLVILLSIKTASGVVTGHLWSYYDGDRRAIARYQACAWQDRANKWEELWQRCDDDGIREPKIRTAMYECLDIAKAWRAWEK